MSLFSLPVSEQIRFQGETIAFYIHKGSRRRKRLAIRVTREGQVDVLVPPRASRKEALWAVEARGEWILRHVRAALARPQALPLQYVQGEAHWFLGQAYNLVFTPPAGSAQAKPLEKAVRPDWPQRFDDAAEACRTDRRARVQLASDDRLLVCVADPTPEAVRKALQVWYRAEATQLLTERLRALCTPIPWLAAVPPLRIRAMRRRWGSCTSRGELTLNTHLIKAPLRCIDYVLLHELAHLQEHNHSKRYYAVLEQLVPDWKTVRRELETLAPLLLNT